MKPTQDTIIIPVGAVDLAVPVTTVLQALFAKLMPVAPIVASPLSIPRIGEFWAGQGGVYAGLMRGVNGVPDYHLVVPNNAKASGKAKYATKRGNDEPGANCMFDGLRNTKALCESKNSHPAAEWAASLEIDGHRDFYLPATHEQSLAYANVPELFEKVWHWSSTQYAADADCAWVQGFADGTQYYDFKDVELAVRPVRRILAIQ